MSGLLLLIVVVVVAFFAIGAYNKLISLKNQVQNAWKQIDVQLKRRHDLIPNLINTVKGAMNFERETLGQSLPHAIRQLPLRLPAALLQPRPPRRSSLAPSAVFSPLSKLTRI